MSKLNKDDLVGFGFSGSDVIGMHHDIRLMLVTYLNHFNDAFKPSAGLVSLMDALAHVVENGIEAPTEEDLQEEDI